MLTDLKSWLEALKLPVRIIVGLLIACITLLALYVFKVLTFEFFGEHTIPILIILSVVFGALSLAHLGELLFGPFNEARKQSILSKRRDIRRQEAEADRAERQRAALARLDHLSADELRLIADALREGAQSIYIYFHSPPAGTLIGKGLLYTPGGTYHQDHYPFTFHDFVWTELIARKDEFIAKDDENQRRNAEEENNRKRRGRRY